MDQDYLEGFPCALGRVVGNLWSLEWMLRQVLYLVGHPPHTKIGYRELTIHVGFPRTSAIDRSAISPRRIFSQSFYAFAVSSRRIQVRRRVHGSKGASSA